MLSKILTRNLNSIHPSIDLSRTFVISHSFRVYFYIFSILFFSFYLLFCFFSIPILNSNPIWHTSTPTSFDCLWLSVWLSCGFLVIVWLLKIERIIFWQYNLHESKYSFSRSFWSFIRYFFLLVALFNFCYQFVYFKCQVMFVQECNFYSFQFQVLQIQFQFQTIWFAEYALNKNINFVQFKLRAGSSLFKSFVQIYCTIFFSFYLSLSLFPSTLSDVQVILLWLKNSLLFTQKFSLYLYLCIPIAT